MIIITLSTIGIMIYRIAISIILMTSNDKEFMKHVPLIASATGSLFTAILIVITHKVAYFKLEIKNAVN